MDIRCNALEVLVVDKLGYCLNISIRRFNSMLLCLGHSCHFKEVIQLVSKFYCRPSEKMTNISVLFVEFVRHFLCFRISGIILLVLVEVVLDVGLLLELKHIHAIGVRCETEIQKVVNVTAGIIVLDFSLNNWYSMLNLLLCLLKQYKQLKQRSQGDCIIYFNFLVV